jgi:hypothetical protein
MTATSPPPGAGQPAVRPSPSIPATIGGVGGAVLVVGARIGLWLGVQLSLAGLLLVAGWWMVYAALVDLGTLGVISWLLRRDGGSYRGLLGPPTTAWQVALGAAGGAGSQRAGGGVQRRAHQRPLWRGGHPAQLRPGRSAPLPGHHRSCMLRGHAVPPRTGWRGPWAGARTVKP